MRFLAISLTFNHREDLIWTVLWSSVPQQSNGGCQVRRNCKAVRYGLLSYMHRKMSWPPRLTVFFETETSAMNLANHLWQMRTFTTWFHNMSHKILKATFASFLIFGTHTKPNILHAFYRAALLYSTRDTQNNDAFYRVALT